MAISWKQQAIILRLVTTWKIHQELSILQAKEQPETAAPDLACEGNMVLSEKLKKLILEKKEQWLHSSFDIFYNPKVYCLEEDEKKKEEQICEVCEREEIFVYVKDEEEFKKKTDKEIRELLVNLQKNRVWDDDDEEEEERKKKMIVNFVSKRKREEEEEEDLSLSHEIFKSLKVQTENVAPDWECVRFDEKSLSLDFKKEQTENASPDWECVYSYEEKRLKTLVDGDAEWEKKHHLWEIENGLVPTAEEVSPEEKVYSYEEKRLKTLVDGDAEWEKKHHLWEIENGLVPTAEEVSPEEKVYSYEEKRLKTLVDGDAEWEKKHHLWEIQNGLVPIDEEVFTPEERELEEKRKRKKEILLALSLRSQEEDQKKQEEAFYKRLQELHIKPLTEEEKKLKQTYLDNVEKVRLGKMKNEDFYPFGPGWDLAYYDIPDGKFPPLLPPAPSLPTAHLVPTASLTPEFWQQLYEKNQPIASVTQTTESRTPVSSNFATEERCRIGLYLTPYCKCDPNCRKYHNSQEEHPPEIAKISNAYARQCRQTHYFDIDDYIDGTVYPLGPFNEIRGEAEIIMELANRAIQEYNEKESNVFKYKVLKIEKVNRSVAMYMTYWMTVIVSNLTLGTPIETFQIHACFSPVNDDSEVLCCRPKEEPIVGLPSCEFCFGLLPEGRVTGGQEP